MAPWWPGTTLLLSKAPRKLVFLFTLSLSITYLFYSLLSCYSSLQFPLQEANIFLQPEPGSSAVATIRTSSSEPQTSRREVLFIQETPRRPVHGSDRDSTSPQVTKAGTSRLPTLQSSFGASIATDEKKWTSGGPSLSVLRSVLGDLGAGGIRQQTGASSHSPSFSEISQLHSVSSSAPAQRNSADGAPGSAARIHCPGSSPVTSAGEGAGTSSSPGGRSTGEKENCPDSSGITSSEPRIREPSTSSELRIRTQDREAITSSEPRSRDLDREVITSSEPRISSLDREVITSSEPRISSLDSSSITSDRRFSTLDSSSVVSAEVGISAVDKALFSSSGPRFSTLDRAPSLSSDFRTLDRAPSLPPEFRRTLDRAPSLPSDFRTLDRAPSLPSDFRTLDRAPSLPSDFRTLGRAPSLPPEFRTLDRAASLPSEFRRTLDRAPSLPPEFRTLDRAPSLPPEFRRTLDRAPSTSAGVSTLEEDPIPGPYASEGVLSTHSNRPIALGIIAPKPNPAGRAGNSGRTLGRPSTDNTTDLTPVPSADLGSRLPPGRDTQSHTFFLASSLTPLNLPNLSSHAPGAGTEASSSPEQKPVTVQDTRDTLFVPRTRMVTPLYNPSQTTDTAYHAVQESVSHKANDQRIPTPPSPGISVSRFEETSEPLVSTGSETQPVLSSWDGSPLASTEMIPESQAGYLEKEPQESSTTEEELSRRNCINTTAEYGDKKLPQAIIIGVKKGGTRALLEALRAHPDVRAVGVEPHFFDRNYDKGLEWYRDLMPRTVDGQITMEKTPSYFVTNDAPQRIHSMAKDTKLIVVVRNPVTRAISDYTQTLSKKPEIPTFEVLAFKNRTLGLIDASWSALRIGIYALHLESWMQYFPLSQMLFVSGEHLISNPAEELAKVQEFLGLRRIITDKHFHFNKTKGFPCLKKPEDTGAPRCLGKSKGRIHPKIDPDVIRRLRKFYKPFNAMFYQMTGEDFQWEKEELEG